MNGAFLQDDIAFYIDVHSHILPDFYLDALRDAGINDIDGWPIPSWSVRSALEAMDDHKVATQVLSLSSPGVHFLKGDEAVELARKLNEYLHLLVVEHNPRFGSLAVLPLPNIEASLEELRYSFDSLSMDGVALLSNYDGLYLGDPAYAPLLAELDRRRATVLVHPTPPPHFSAFTLGLPAPALEYTFDSTRMAQHLVQTGAKKRYPDVTIIVAHGGGTLPYSKPRLVKYAMGNKDDVFDTFAYEMTATTEPEQIRALLSLAHPDNCFMGFDYPFMKPEWWDELQSSLEGFAFAEGVLRGIQNRNALRQFPNVKRRLQAAGWLD